MPCEHDFRMYGQEKQTRLVMKSEVKQVVKERKIKSIANRLFLLQYVRADIENTDNEILSTIRMNFMFRNCTYMARLQNTENKLLRIPRETT